MYPCINDIQDAWRLQIQRANQRIPQEINTTKRHAKKKHAMQNQTKPTMQKDKKRMKQKEEESVEI